MDSFQDIVPVIQDVVACLDSTDDEKLVEEIDERRDELQRVHEAKQKEIKDIISGQLNMFLNNNENNSNFHHLLIYIFVFWSC